MTGIMKGSLPGDNLDFAAALRATRDLGLDACLFSLFDISPTLDRQELLAARSLAESLGVALAGDIGVMHPFRTERSIKTLEAGQGDLGTGVERLVEAAGILGLADLMFVIGTIDDRFDAELAWATQLDAVVELFERLRPTLLAHGVRLTLKTHEEITSHEILALIDRVGNDVLGVALDPVNMVCRMEDPVAATRRLAPHVRTVHLEDAILRLEPEGMRRYLCPVGEGVLDWRAILQLVPDAPRFIDLHRGQFVMPVLSRDWVDSQPIDAAEYGAVLLMAVRDKGADIHPQQEFSTRLDPALQHFSAR